MNDILERAMAVRKAAGLALIIYGLEGYTKDQPFTHYCVDERERDRLTDRYRDKGWTVEAP